MKKKSILLSLVALCVLALFSCSDKNDAPSYSSKALKNAELVNILKAKGYTFNENGQLALNDQQHNITWFERNEVERLERTRHIPQSPRVEARQ